MATIVISTDGSAFGQEVVLPEGEAKEIVEAACSSCHELSEVTKNRLSREDWQEMVSIMIEFGAELEESQIPVLVDYLTQHFGPETATGDEEVATPQR